MDEIDDDIYMIVENIKLLGSLVMEQGSICNRKKQLNLMEQYHLSLMLAPKLLQENITKDQVFAQAVCCWPAS